MENVSAQQRWKPLIQAPDGPQTEQQNQATLREMYHALENCGGHPDTIGMYHRQIYKHEERMRAAGHAIPPQRKYYDYERPRS